MNYCAVADIQLAMGGITFSSTSKPTLTQITDMIADCSGEIDLAFDSIGIQIITSTKILSWAKRTCIYGVAGQASIQFNATTMVNGQGSRTNEYLKAYEKRIDSITKTPELFGVTADVSSNPISNQVLDGTITEQKMIDNTSFEKFKP